MDTTTDQHEAAERDMRELLQQNGLPQPDEVEYRERSILMLWHETKLAVVIDLDEPPSAEGGEMRSV
jgi:hypothetical protein